MSFPDAVNLTGGGGGTAQVTPKMDESVINTIQSMEKKIIQEFHNETESLTRLYSAEDNLDSLKQSIVKSLGKIDESTRSYLSNLKIRHQQYEEQLQRAQDQREAVLREVETLPKSQFAYQYCLSLYEKEHTKIV